MGEHQPNVTTETTRPVKAQGRSSGCMQTGALSLLIGWIVLTTAFIQILTWVMEQQLFSGPVGVQDLRWLFTLLYGLGILIPAAVLWRVGRNSSTAPYYLGFALAGLYVVILAPARLAAIDEAQAAAGLVIVFTLLFLLVEQIFRPSRLVICAAPGRLGRSVERSVWRGWGVALLAAGLVGIPWVLWGALGSLLDILLSLAAAVLFGIAAARVVDLSLWREASELPQAGNVFGAGLVAAAALLVMINGLGVNGSQGLFALVVPPLGWSLAALSRRARMESGQWVSNWPALALLAGLAAFWPAAFIDPDELAAVIGQSPGEIIQWANLAAGVSLGIAVLVGIVLVLLRRSLTRLPAALVLAPAGLVWLAAAVLYGLVGQPGLHGERLFVILADQADVSAAEEMGDDVARRAFVYRTLVDHAESTQQGLRADLDRWNIAYQPYYLENALEVEGGPLVRLWLETRPEVDRVLDSPVLRPLPYDPPPAEGSNELPPGVLWNLAEIRANQVWEELGVRGAGIVIGQSDSGAQGDHVELADSYRGRGGQGDNYNWYDPWNQSTSPVDTGGHGTHTLGTALGNQVGVAPDAEWIGCVNLARNLGNPALYLECMQFMLAPFPQGGSPLNDGRPELGAHVINNSWGCPPVEGCDPTALLHAVTALRAAGVFVVSSAGNDGDGGCGSVKDPISLYDPAYSVGAIDSSGELAGFSSLGPVEVDGSRRIKPDIAAPGVEVLSAFPGGTYFAASGTSMAGPHVAGVVALMWSANPQLIGEIEATEQILNETAAEFEGKLPDCVAPGRPNNAAGYGVLNAYAAVQRALDWSPGTGTDR